MTDTAARYDIAIVGGGTSGCILAARLSEDPSRRVVLIEAGPDPRPVPNVIRDPARQGELVGGSDFVRRYAVSRPDGSAVRVLSGRVVGGGSTVNNLAAIRPMRADFDTWARFGGARWSYRSMLPVLCSIEDDDAFGDAEHHGRGGPVPIEHPVTLDGNPAIDALVRAAADLGLPRCDDVNGPLPFGVCAPAYTTRAGERASTAATHLEHARTRPNLTILADTTVARIAGAGRVATGVDVIANGRRRTVAAGKVILSAGVFHSPQVLMLSGVGATDALASLGIPAWLPLDGVGRGLSDHAVVPLAFDAGPDPAAADLPKLRIVARSDPARAIPDLHVFVRPARRRDGTATMPVSVHLLEHRLRGTVRLASLDPFEIPAVELRLAEHPDDVRALVNGMGLVERLAMRPALRPFIGPLRDPAAGVDRAAYVRRTFESYQHSVGTCRFGPDDDPDAVVMSDLRLRGTDNVWVADASVLPTVPHGNPNLAVMLVAETAARDIAAA